MEKFYIEHKGKVINTNNKFAHVMAITLNPQKDHKEGVLRCITKREGNVQIKGYGDRSELYKVKGNSFESFEITDCLNIKNRKEILSKLIEKD